jgi:hypothetical protein
VIGRRSDSYRSVLSPAHSLFQDDAPCGDTISESQKNVCRFVGTGWHCQAALYLNLTWPICLLFKRSILRLLPTGSPELQELERGGQLLAVKLVYSKPLRVWACQGSSPESSGSRVQGFTEGSKVEKVATDILMVMILPPIGPPHYAARFLWHCTATIRTVRFLMPATV